MSGLLEQALRYAAAGWPVFPCKADGTPEHEGWKAPLTDHGFRDATTDPGPIGRWWARWPRANVAVATGAPGPDVLDVDVKPDGSGFAAFNRLKAAGLLTGARALVRTPSGGFHAYYTGTSQPSGRLPRHFLDFKASGGYVIAPPSAVGGRPYELLDSRSGGARMDWQTARRMLDPPRPLPRPGSGAGTDALAAWVAAQREGNRNDGLFWAACRATESDSPSGDIEQLVDAAVRAGLPEDEARRTVASAARKAAAR